MILRWLAREFREYPATCFFCLAWIIVFAAMTGTHLASGMPILPSRWLIFGFGGGERFGDLTLHELARGQVWRLVTCNFVHYSLIHLGLNLLAMYQLGSIVEAWYGSHQLIFIYGLTGGVGNLVSALLRIWNRSNREVHSAGGSVVIMGLVGLCAVAGWRSKSQDGRWLSKLMLLFIVLTAALGIVFPRFIDNWGHGCGLMVGAALGFAHRRLRARVGKPSAWAAGVLTGLILVGSAVAQFVTDRREGPARLERSLARRSDYLARASGEMMHLRRPIDLRRCIAAAAKWLDDLDPGRYAQAKVEFQGLRPLLQDALKRPLTEKELGDLDRQLVRALIAIRREGQSDLMPGGTAVLEDLKRELDEYGHMLNASKWMDMLDELLVGPARAELRGLRPLVDAAMQHTIAADERRELDERLTRALAALRQEYEADRRRLRALRRER
jgi:membrane associated rhomboid family serine protease